MASTPSLLTRGLAGRQQRAGLMFALPAALLFATILGYPIFESFRTSLFSMDLLTGRATFAGFGNFGALLHDEALRSTLGLTAALLIDADWPGMRWIRQLLLVPYVIPVIASALVWRWMLDGNYGILSTNLQSWGVLQQGANPLDQESTSLATVILINIWRGFPFAMLVFWARMQTIDRGQYEAAKVDGAGPWQEFTRITLPNLRSAMMSLLALRGIWTLMYFELVWP